MKIIDTHMHTTFSNQRLHETAKISGVKCSVEGLKKEMRNNDVVFGISLQTCPTSKYNCEEYDPTESFEGKKGNILQLIAINPYRASNKYVKKYEALIKAGKVKGFKIYLGYYYFYPNDKIYIPFYRLAEKYGLIVIFHTGDTACQYAKIKYSHPLNIDDVAVDYPTIRFVMAHFGEPWAFDAAEILFKNKNVYADISGLSNGDLKPPRSYDPHKIRKALGYADCYDRILYGSDWPLVPMKEYIRLMKKLIPKEHHQKVFHDNAAKLFGIKD